MAAVTQTRGLGLGDHSYEERKSSISLAFI